MTGLTRNEFEKMLPAFQKAWDEYIQQAYIDREGLQRQYGGGQQASTLVSMEDKLLFILYYVKVYPLQEILAFEFGISQSTAKEWIHLLSGVLKRALDFGDHLLQKSNRNFTTVELVASFRLHEIRAD
jgi:DDE superfamily endonuclease